MIHWILVKTRNSDTKYAAKLRESGLSTVECHTAKGLNDLYQNWDLPLP
jgi:hypothetical protein